MFATWEYSGKNLLSKTNMFECFKKFPKVFLLLFTLSYIGIMYRPKINSFHLVENV